MNKSKTIPKKAPIAPKKAKILSYQEEKDIWYQKLKEEGFIDIEGGQENSPYTRNWKIVNEKVDHNLLSNHYNEKAEFFRKAGIWLHNGWVSETYKILFAYCQYGYSIQKLSDLFKWKVHKMRKLIEEFRSEVNANLDTIDGPEDINQDTTSLHRAIEEEPTHNKL